MTPLNVFVTEGNVEIYLSKLHTTQDAVERDHLLRLVVEEEARMGLSREHLENGERRVADGRRRIESQRQLVTELSSLNVADGSARRVLDTLEKTQALLEAHVHELRIRFEQTQL